MDAEQVVAQVRASKAAHPQFNQVYLGPCAVVKYQPTTISGLVCFEVATIIPRHLVGGWVAVASPDGSVVTATYLDHPEPQLKRLRQRVATRLFLERGE